MFTLVLITRLRLPRVAFTYNFIVTLSGHIKINTFSVIRMRCAACAFGSGEGEMGKI